MWNSPKNPDISYNENLIYIWVWFLKIQITNPTVWQSNQYLYKSFLPAPKPRSPLEYRVLLSQTLHKHSWTQHKWTEVEKNSQMRVPTIGPGTQLGLKQNVASLITAHQFGGEAASSDISLPQAHPQAHTESCLSSIYKTHQKPPQNPLCSSYLRFSVFMHALCSHLQECIDRALPSINLNLNHSLMPQQQDENTAVLSRQHHWLTCCSCRWGMQAGGRHWWISPKQNILFWYFLWNSAFSSAL